MAMRYATGHRACTRRSTGATSICGWSTDAARTGRGFAARRARACGKAQRTITAIRLPLHVSRTLPLLLAVAPFAARAQDVPAGDPNGDIVVLGRGLALPPGTPSYGAVTSDRARLDGDASGRVEDVLADVAGFQQFRRSDSRSANPSAQGVTLRALGGNASSRALVLLDGVPIADPFFGYIPFTALSPARLAAVRLTRGLRNSPALNMGGKGGLRPPVGPDHVLRLGVDLRRARGQLYEDAYTAGVVSTRRTAGGESSTLGAFVEDDWTIGKFVLTAGARIDHWTLPGGFLQARRAAG